VELEVVAEHVEQVLLESHHQRVHPRVEQHVGALPPDLRRVAGRHVLHVDGRRDHRAGDAQALGRVALHLRAEHELGGGGGDARLDVQVVVAHERLDPVLLPGGAHLPRELAAVGAESDECEPELLDGHARGRARVRRVAEHEHTLAGQVRRVHRARVPRQPRRVGRRHRRLDPGGHGDLAQEVAGRAHADRHRAHHGQPERALDPRARRPGHLGRVAHHEVALGDAPQVVDAGAQRRDHVRVHARLGEQGAQLAHVVARAEAEHRRPEHRGPRPPPRLARRPRRPGRRRQRPAHRAHELVEGLRRAPVLLLAVRRQLERHHRHREAEPLGERPGLVLDQLRGARLADEHRVGPEALRRVAHRLDDQPGRVAAEVARLEGGVRDRGRRSDRSIIVNRRSAYVSPCGACST
jgi:hypothetical protein